MEGSTIQKQITFFILFNIFLMLFVVNFIKI